MSALQSEIEAAVRSAIAPLEARIEALTTRIAQQNGEDQDRWLSVSEAAEAVGRDRKTIRRWIADGQLETRRVGPKGGRVQVLQRSLAR